LSSAALEKKKRKGKRESPVEGKAGKTSKLWGEDIGKMGKRLPEKKSRIKKKDAP